MKFQANCPNCGAQVTFESSAAIFAVCGHCRGAVHRDPNLVKDMGEIGQVLEDYSPIQIGTSGIFQGKAFTVLGRIQVRYEAGLWNEWYVFFDNGSTGWLADTSGQYMMTVAVDNHGDYPVFENLRIDDTIQYQGVGFYATDIRRAQCIGAQGELPQVVGSNTELKVADFRVLDRFLTLDYTQSNLPVCYVGQPVDLTAMKCQHLRTEAEIEVSAGQILGDIASFSCPNCGASLEFRVGMATQVNCGTCGSVVDCSGNSAIAVAAKVKSKGRMAKLKLGEVGNLRGHAWTIIGLIEREEPGASEYRWVEYLLFNQTQGFIWLVQTKEAWYEVEVLNQMPNVFSGSQVAYQNKQYQQDEQYSAKVVYAVGAFNWRVQVGDTCRVTQFSRGSDYLSKEQDSAESTWSLSMLRPEKQVLTWFGKINQGPTKGPNGFMQTSAQQAEIDDATKFTWPCLGYMWGANFFISLDGGDSTIFLISSAVASALILGPYLFLYKFKQ